MYVHPCEVKKQYVHIRTLFEEVALVRGGEEGGGGGGETSLSSVDWW